VLFLTPALLLGQKPDGVVPERKKLPAISLLPDGSRLHGVMLPRYDENRKLTGVLKAASMTLVNAEQMAGESVSVEFFNPDQSPRGRVDLKKAIFHQTKGILEAREPVHIQADRLTAHGSGLYYSFQQGEGFLLGPATTIIHALTETTMHTPPSSLRAVSLLGVSLLTQPLVAAPPPAMNAEEKAAVQADAVSKSPAAAAASAATQKLIQTDLADSEIASKGARAFLVQADLPVPTAGGTSDAEAQDVKPGPDDTVITSDGGMYFDADAGCLVYLKNVKVSDPRIEMTARDELKIFFAKKPVGKPASEKPENPKNSEKNDKGALAGVGDNFGDVERIVATGAVRAIQKKPEDGEAPVEASGALFSYHLKTGQIILQGGKPWVKRGGLIIRAKTPEQTLRINKAGVFDFSGPTETILPLEELNR
jgi:lipopolysaccharide export system protein LptA